jgi:hypothetical protein
MMSGNGDGEQEQRLGLVKGPCQTWDQSGSVIVAVFFNSGCAHTLSDLASGGAFSTDNKYRAGHDDPNHGVL